MPGIDVNLSDVSRESCLDGWEYDRSVYTATITTEVCAAGVTGASMIRHSVSEERNEKEMIGNLIILITIIIMTIFFTNNLRYF